VGRHRLRELCVHDARLDYGDPILRIDSQDAVHARALDHDASFERDRSPGEPGAGAARNEGHPVCTAGPDDAGDFGLVPRKHDCGWQGAVDGEAVRLVDEQVLGA
jgi:hypothetical protein